MDPDKFTSKPWKFHVDIPFPSNRQAVVAQKSLQVDEEPRKEEITRTFKTCENILSVYVVWLDILKIIDENIQFLCYIPNPLSQP